MFTIQARDRFKRILGSENEVQPPAIIGVTLATVGVTLAIVGVTLAIVGVTLAIIGITLAIMRVMLVQIHMHVCLGCEKIHYQNRHRALFGRVSDGVGVGGAVGIHAQVWGAGTGVQDTRAHQPLEQDGAEEIHVRSNRLALIGVHEPIAQQA